jgi:hypothetical protein
MGDNYNDQKASAPMEKGLWPDQHNLVTRVDGESILCSMVTGDEKSMLFIRQGKTCNVICIKSALTQSIYTTQHGEKSLHTLSIAQILPTDVSTRHI